MSALPILTILKDGETVKSQPIDTEILVGRGEGCVVRLEDRAVSRQHATFRVVPEGIRVDKKSEFAPLKINGAESTGAVVKDGDVIEIGPYLARVAFPKPVQTQSTEAPVEKTPSGPKQMLDMDAIGTDSPAPSPADSILASSPVEVDMTAMDVSSDADESAPPASSGDIGLALDDNLPFEPAPDGGLNLDFGSETAESGKNGEAASQSSSFGAGGGGMELDLGSDDGIAPLEGADPVSSGTDGDGKTQILKSDLVAQLVIENGQANVDAIDLDKDEILIGRGKECEVVINDKKASRKNTVIVRDGNHYIIRDLGSSNGTFVNGKKITEHRLEADDKVDVGDVRFRFVAKSALYEEKEKDFTPIPTLSDLPSPETAAHSFESGEADAGVSSALAADDSLASQLPSSLPQFISHTDSMGGTVGADALNSAPVDEAAPQTQEPKSPLAKIYVKYIRNFKELKPAQKLLVVLVGFLFISWYLEDDSVPVPQTKPVAQQTQGGVKTYENLTPEQQKIVNGIYEKAYAAFVKQDFDSAILEVRKIYQILPDYEKAKDLERYANEGKRRFAAKEEERKKKEEEARLKARVAELAEEADALMKEKKYTEAEEKFPEILSIDPENEQVAVWKDEIQKYIEEQKRIEQEKAVQVAINQRAWDTFKEGQALYKKGQYRDAIKTLEGVFDLGSDDQKVLAKTKAMIKTSKDAIRDLRDPILTRAQNKEKEGELALAFKLYEKVTQIDPDHPAAYMGMERIRGVLQDKAKIMYTEAIVAESYSDFDTAYTTFNRILKTAPEGSLYYERAQRKLAAYFHYHSKGGDAAESDTTADSSNLETSSEAERSTASENGEASE